MATAGNITNISNELSLIYSLRVSEYYGVGKVKLISKKDRTRIWLKMNQPLVEALSDISIIYPSKFEICNI